MAIQKWQKLKTKRVYTGWQNMDLVSYKMPDGRVADFDIVDSTGKEVISVVGLTKEKKVILVKQFRPGPKKIFYEFPLGLIEKGEKPKKAAQREFLEETGYEGNLSYLGEYFFSSYDGAKVHCFAATDCQKKSNKLKLDKNEYIEVELVPLVKAREMLKKCQIRNFGEGYLALDYLGLL